MNTEKSSQIESKVSSDCIFLLELVIIMRRSSFDTGFAAQIKFIKVPLIHYFLNKMSFHKRRGGGQGGGKKHEISVLINICIACNF